MPFDPALSLGALPPTQIAAYLTDIGDLDAAAAYTPGSVAAQGALWRPHVWAHTGMVLGFIDVAAASISSSVSAIVGASKITAEAALIGSRIKISLDKFYVHQYPGGGEHNILCEFTGKNQVPGDTEDLRYTLRFRAADRASPSLSGVPVFMGITVAADGISFSGRTVNVDSSSDETLLAIMDTPTFRAGLGLLTAAQPVLKPFAGLAGAAVQSVLSRSKNKQVHTFDLGLDFGGGATSARLRLGTYVLIQCNDAAGWNWEEYHWNRDAMALQHKLTGKHPEFNYMAFGVTPYHGSKS